VNGGDVAHTSAIAPLVGPAVASARTWAVALGPETDRHDVAPRDEGVERHGAGHREQDRDP
jgi:hypothetical protein